jgi:uncharacterized membrane protein YkoI
MQNKLTIPLLALAIIGVGGTVYTIKNSGATSVHAQVVTATTQPTKADDVNGDQNEPQVKSSIQTSDSSTEVNDTFEAEQLKSLAKISDAQAKASAEKSAGGTATTVKLESENGNVVYSVTVNGKEVKIDAGNGSVLRTETAEGADDKGKDGIGD